MKKIVLFIFGLFLVSLGATFLINVSHFGIGPWDALYLSLQKQFGFTYGIWYFICSIIYSIFALFIDKSKIGLTSILAVFLTSAFIDGFIYLNILSQSNNTFINILYFILGVIIMGSGIGIYIQCGFAVSPREAFVLSLSKLLRFPIAKIEITLSVLIVVIVLLLKGPIHIGTFIISLLLGPVIQIASTLTKKYIK